MIPWHKMPKDLQRAVLAMIVCFGGASAGCRLFPMVCDPPPPPSVTPMICDPPPPPPSTTPTVTPMICDPPPPPSATPTVTPMICDPPPPPPSVTPTVTPMICDPPPPPPSSAASSARPSYPPAAEGAARDMLPLAEVRTVEIVWQSGFTFAAETPWPGATLMWTASGGALHPYGTRVDWHPPTLPGRYQLQVVADWGARGLAVDALVVEVEEDGSVRLC